ncbi:MAG: hypothetical protein KDA25_08040, partial [Phycisphaerales bacterium]|nr:hypothetical protein [Phycisphaerales bacterium]
MRHPLIRTRRSLMAAAAGGVVLAMSASTLAEPGQTATLVIQVNGEAPVAFDLPGLVNDSDDGVDFVGDFVDPAGGWQLGWNLSAFVNANGDDVINGAFTAVNQGTAEMEIFFRIDVPFCPLVTDGSLIGGLTQIQMQTNGNGGAVSSGSGPALWTGRLDGETAKQLFVAPYVMSASGASSMSTYSMFGNPFPSAAGPRMLDKATVEYDFRLTDGDQVTVTTNYIFGVDPDAAIVDMPENPCASDLNRDGRIDQLDLVAVFNDWGLIGGCRASDIDGNGIVGEGDTAAILASWGPCYQAAEA